MSRRNAVVYFNPHSPCGERHASCIFSISTFVFQSTLPLRGATKPSGIIARHSAISIHTPLAGSDVSAAVPTAAVANFNPHSPCGERRCSVPPSVGTDLISIHTPLAGSDDAAYPLSSHGPNFNPHSPCGERPQKLPNSH